MSESDYEYECMRAELFGLPKPDRTSFLSAYHEKENSTNDLEDAMTEDIELQSEQINRVSGGVDELNSILTITQKKLNKFKTVCGSLTNLLKLRLSGDGGSSSSSGRTSRADDQEDEERQIQSEEQGVNSPSKGTMKVDTHKKKLDLEKEVESQVDKLDSLLDKTETAQFRLASQNKQIKSFLNK